MTFNMASNLTKKKQIEKWEKRISPSLNLSLPKKINRIVIVKICRQKILRNDLDASADVQL
jgi:hypothetical protein